MEDPEDLSSIKLDKCSYRYLQQMAKSFGLPSNVKKMYLIEMIHTKKYCSEQELDAVVVRIKEERKQFAKTRKPMKRKKKRLQGIEISSTSNPSPPLSMESQTSDYIITYPPVSPTARRTHLKYRPPNILRPTIGKKPIESDRVLRSFNNRLRPNYNFLNLNNSVIGVIKSQNLQQSREVQERQYELNVAFQRHRPLNIGECVEQRPIPVGYGHYSVQRRQVNFEDMDGTERQLLPVSRSSNVFPRPAQRQRRISGIYPLKQSEQSYYQYTTNVGLRREDGRISKINAMVQKPVPRTDIPGSIVKSKTTQTCIIGRNLIPHPRSIVKKVAAMSNMAIALDRNYKSDQRNFSNSSTESARDSSTERENISIQNKNRSSVIEILNENTKSRSCGSKSLIRYAEIKTQATENLIKYTSSNNHIARNASRYADSRHHTTNNANGHTGIRNFSIVNCNKNTESRSYYKINSNRYTENRRFSSDLPTTETRSFATSSNSYVPSRNHAIENLNRGTETRSHVTEEPNRYTEGGGYAMDNPNNYTEIENSATVNTNTSRYIETSSHATENQNSYLENRNQATEITKIYTETGSDASAKLNRYTEIECSAAEYLNTYTETRSSTAENQKTESSYIETPKRYRNNATEIPYTFTEIVATENDSKLTEKSNTVADLQQQLWNVATDYPNMSALTDIDLENQATELPPVDPSNNVSVYYHKKIRAEQVRSQRTSAAREPAADDKLPRITDVFSQFNDAQYRSLTQPLYVQVSEESEKILPHSVMNSTMLEKLYNCSGQLLSVSNEPLLQVITTTNTQCVFSTPTITTAIEHPSAAVCKEYNAHLYEPANQQYNIETETIPRLYDYLRVAEQEQKDFECSEVLSSSSSFGTTSSQLGANVTIPEMVEDALELISQDGDYMERIEMDVRMQCILCDWAGPKIIMEHHFKEAHPSSIVEREGCEWRAAFSLGGLASRDTWASQLSRARGRLYVLSATCAGDRFMASLTVLPNASEEISKYCRLTVYNKVTGEPHTWEGEVTYLPDTMPHRAAQGLALDITSLDLLPNSAHLKLVNGELVLNSTAKVVVGQPELDNIEIEVYVKIFD